MQWPEVSPPVRDLIRRGAELALSPPPTWRQQLEDAIFRGPARGVIAEDPELAASTRRAIESTVDTWRRANLEHPGEPVAAALSDETLDLVRDLVRRGLDDSALDAYRAFCDERGITMLEATFGWLLAQPGVASVIAGATSAAQIEANARAGGAWTPSADEIAAIDALLPLPADPAA